MQINHTVRRTPLRQRRRHRDTVPARPARTGSPTPTSSTEQNGVRDRRRHEPRPSLQRSQQGRGEPPTSSPGRRATRRPHNVQGAPRFKLTPRFVAPPPRLQPLDQLPQPNFQVRAADGLDLRHGGRAPRPAATTPSPRFSTLDDIRPPPRPAEQRTTQPGPPRQEIAIPAGTPPARRSRLAHLGHFQATKPPGSSMSLRLHGGVRAGVQASPPQTPPPGPRPGAAAAPITSCSGTPSVAPLSRPQAFQLPPPSRQTGTASVHPHLGAFQVLAIAPTRSPAWAGARLQHRAQQHRAPRPPSATQTSTDGELNDRHSAHFSATNASPPPATSRTAAPARP